MKSRIRYIIPALAFASLALLFSGCLEKRISWSPDGTRAAVIGSEGLRLCDAKGTLTGVLAPDVYSASWLGDSRRLVLARHRVLRQWSEIAPLLGTEREKVEARAGELFREHTSAGNTVRVNLNLKGGDDLPRIALRDLYADPLKARLAPEAWKELVDGFCVASELVLAQLEGDRLVIGPVLHLGLKDVVDVRPSPDNRAAAVTFEAGGAEQGFLLAVVTLAGPARTAIVALNTSAYPDWQDDGRTLVYFESQAGESSKEDLCFGALTQRTVLDATGRIDISSDKRAMAGVVFSAFARVRCLRDGRILFNAAEFSLPMSIEDFSGEQQEQLFAVDLKRPATLIRLIPRKSEDKLPQTLAYFEVSPDEQQVLFGGTKGEVCLLTLATGDVSVVQGADQKVYQGLPVWRKAGEYSYVKRSKANNGAEPARPVEIVLQSGDEESVLSSSWADDVLAGIAKNTSQ